MAGEFGIYGAYWNEIQTAAANRVGTAAVFQAVKVAHLEATGEILTGGFTEINALYSRAVGNRERSLEFMGANPASEIRPEHIGAIPNAPPPPPGGSPRRYLVRFEQQLMRGGERVTEIRTDVFRTGLPGSKQSLMNRLHRYGATLAEEYEDETHTGIGQVWILAA
jgi:hypothetical protein